MLCLQLFPLHHGITAVHGQVAHIAVGDIVVKVYLRKRDFVGKGGGI